MPLQKLSWLTPQKIDSLQSPLETTALLMGESVERVIIALHGFGDHAASFASLAQDISLQNTLWLFPNGPMSAPFAGEGRQWFPLFSSPKPSFEQSLNLLCTLYEHVLSDLSLSPTKVFFLGFSQGAAMAAHTVWELLFRRQHTSLGGLLMLSGFVLPGYFLDAYPKERDVCALMPVFLAHGLQDQVVFPTTYFDTHLFLQTRFERVVSKTYAMGHTVCGQEISDMIKFIRHDI